MSESEYVTGDQFIGDPCVLDALVQGLAERGYQVVGPRVVDDAILYQPIRAAHELPHGWLDEQDGGHYRLLRDERAGYFDYVVGPQSLKPFVFPPRDVLLELSRRDGVWHDQTRPVAAPQVAVMGVRSCDLHALAIQDRVFLGGEYQDPAYRARREQLFLVAVNCRRAAATCFCHSYRTGPRATSGFDLALTECSSSIVVEVGSPRGAELCRSISELRPATDAERSAAAELSLALERQMQSRRAETPAADGPRQRTLETEGIRELLLGNLNHPHWQQVAERCLSCANCTMVCPTCFCSSVEEVADLTGDQVRRERQWDSCFNADHSRINTGVVRGSTASRYRQWLTHKLATWIDQYGTSGCVGCGRCITWCPVGIDLTAEVAAIREQTS